MPFNNSITKKPRSTYTVLIFDQDKFEQGLPKEDYTVGKREIDFVPRVDDTLIVNQESYEVETVCHELDGLVDEIYVTVRTTENYFAEDEE